MRVATERANLLLAERRGCFRLHSGLRRRVGRGPSRGKGSWSKGGPRCGPSCGLSRGRGSWGGCGLGCEYCDRGSGWLFEYFRIHRSQMRRGANRSGLYGGRKGNRRWSSNRWRSAIARIDCRRREQRTVAGVGGVTGGRRRVRWGGRRAIKRQVDIVDFVCGGKYVGRAKDVGQCRIHGQ